MKTGIRHLNPARHLSFFLFALVFLLGCGQGGEEQASGEDSQASEGAQPTEAAQPADAAGSSEASQPGDRSTREALTARTAYETALGEAEAWAGDAVLVDLNNFRGSDNLDGLGNRWVVKFKSVGLDEELDVHVVRGNRVLQTLDGRNTDKEAIEGDWMDSPDAARAAASHVPDQTMDNYWLGLVSQDGTVSWSVKCDHEDGNATWLSVDARTGEILEG